MHAGLRPAAVCGWLLLTLCGVVLAQVPQGFEIVEIVPSPYYRGSPAVNDCGEIIYSQNAAAQGSQEVFRYDNGAVVQLSDGTGHNVFPHINDAGLTIWTTDYDSYNGEIVVYDGMSTMFIGTGGGARLSNLRHAAWDFIIAETCAFEADILFWKGALKQQISDNPLSNQWCRINNQDGIVWTKGDFCSSPWTSEILLWSAGIIQKLPSVSLNPQLPTINNLGQVAWGSQNGIELWEDGVSTLLTSWGRNPDLNDQGDIYFLRWHQISSVCCWQSWLYRPDNGGEFLRLIDDQFWNTDGENNNWGEVVWRWQYTPYADDGGLRFMRRLRTGEADFDGDIDLEDAAVLHDCLTGPGDFDRLCDCRFLDLDHDRDVDLADFARFQRAYAAP